MNNFIPYSCQNINQEDLNSVLEVLQSDWLTQGPAISRFEKEVAEYCSAKYAVAVSNATGALHIACMAAGLKEGGLSWTTPNTFAASANCALYCGADVGFVDIDSKTYNLSVGHLEQALTKAALQGRLPNVLIPVHFSGEPCEMDKIARLAQKYPITVIEDASHALGAKYRGERIGNCKFSDMTVLSFHPVKMITTGEGGMILTNREDLYQKLLRLRTHGITRDPSLMQNTSMSSSNDNDPWYYEQLDLGYNYRITDIQAALGASQLKRLDSFVQRRRELAKRYHRLLAHLPLALPYESELSESSFHLYVIQLQSTDAESLRRKVFNSLREAKIGVNVHYIPVHLQPYYRRLGFKEGDFPNSETYYSRALSLPLHTRLTEGEQDYVVETLANALSHYR